MPTLEITDEGSYFVRTSINHQIVTYQVRDIGVTFLNQYGIVEGQTFSPKLLQELRERNFVFTNGTGISWEHTKTTTTKIAESVFDHQTTRDDVGDVQKTLRIASYSESKKDCINVVHKDFLSQVEYVKEFNRYGTFLKKQQKYISMSEGEPMMPDFMYCIVFLWA